MAHHDLKAEAVLHRHKPAGQGVGFGPEPEDALRRADSSTLEVGLAELLDLSAGLSTLGRRDVELIQGIIGLAPVIERLAGAVPDLTHVLEVAKDRAQSLGPTPEG